jgi:hypothetical protein
VIDRIPSLGVRATGAKVQPELLSGTQIVAYSWVDDVHRCCPELTPPMLKTAPE